MKIARCVTACVAMLAFSCGLADANGGGARSRFTNPILFADYSDPDAIRVGRDYYLVASSFHFSPGLPVLHSTDLVHWTIIGHVLPKLPFASEYDMPGPHTLTDAISKPIGGTRYASGVWAPAIRYHAGKFFVYWPTPDEGIFMATATNPAGPWSTPTAVIAQAGLEDPCPFWDDDGTAWLIHSRTGAGPLILHRMSADGTRLLDAGTVVAEDKVRLPTLEGPKLYKRAGWYYIFAPYGGVATGLQAVGRARDIRGPYEWRTVLKPGTSGVQGPHQGAWIETPSGQGWFLHFNSTGAFGRIDYLEPLRWIDDWPVIGDPIAGDAEAGQPVASAPMPDTGSPPTRDQIQASDDFASPRLGVQWEWNHNPDDRAWSLTVRPGWLRLTALRSDHLVTARNTLTQILHGPSSRISTRIDVSRMRDGQRAGLSLFGVGPSWIGIAQDDGVRRITLASKGAETPGPRVSGLTVTLRADVASDQTVRYSYSLDGRRFLPFGDAIALAKFSWWKGSRPALFSFTHAVPGGSIDVDSFQVEQP
ncbi:Beta-xylosidase [Sphingomonas sp. NFR15]|nr:Beta-xylosidase [Sphingomonas sp. NFR15]